MKNKLFTVLLTIGVTAAATFIFTITACNNKSEGIDKTVPDNQGTNCNEIAKFNTSLLHPVNKAIQDINYFYTKCQNTVDSNGNPAFTPVSCFTVRAQDLCIALGLPDTVFTFKYVRAYIGYSADSNRFKLYFVPVLGGCLANNDAGNDILINSNGIPDTTNSLSALTNNLYVLDLITPCPSVCPKNNIIYQGGGPNSLKK